MSIKETIEIDTEQHSNGALARPAHPMLGCRTRRPPRTLLPRLARQGHWDRRTFTYAFGKGQIGLTTSPPGPTQTLSVDDARDAVRAAFTQWSTVTSLASKPIRLSFREVDLDDHPDAIVEWVPPKHDAETRDATSGQWTFADDDDMTPGADGPDDVGAGAHADFPPDNVGGIDNEYEEPPIPIHFNDDNPAAWTAITVEAYALHEIGHMLGLEHPEEVAPLPAGVTAVMSNAAAPTLRVLQAHDRNSIEELYGAPGPERFNWIWMKGTIPRRSLRGLTRDELHDEIENTQTPAGFHISQVGAYVLPADTLYTAVVEQGGTPNRHYATDRTRSEFGDLHAEYTADGYRLIDLNNFIDSAGVVRFNGVWARDGVDAWPAVIAFGFIDMFAELNKAKAANYRPVLINGYETADEERWNALFVKQGSLGPPRDWEAHINYSRDEFDAKFAELGDEYDPTYIHTKVLPDGRGERWTGIWEKIAVPSREGYSWIELDFARRTQNLEAQVPGLEVFGLNAFVRAPAPATVSLTASLDVAPTGRREVVLGMATDANRVYVARFAALDKPPYTSERPGVLVVLDQQTLRPVPGLPQLPKQPRGVPVGFEPRSVAVNPKSGKAYVVNYGKDSYSLTVIDIASFGVVTTIGLGQAPHNVAINTQLNRVYVTNMYQQCVHVIDGATDTLLEPIVLGPGVSGITVDEGRNMLYVTVANRSVEPFTNGLFSVIDDVESREILPFVPIGAVGIESQDVVVDHAMDRIYVANQGNIGAGPPSVAVLHRPSRSIVATIPLPGPGRQVDVNTSAGEMYVTTDRGDVQVIDTVSLMVTRVIPTHSAPWAIAAAKGTVQQVFVGDRFDGSVIRIS